MYCEYKKTEGMSKISMKKQRFMQYGKIFVKGSDFF